jgi:putative endonuclease
LFQSAFCKPSRPPNPGKQGERLATRFLRKQGYRIVATNLDEGFGEIDIVAVDRRVLVFVEVKTWMRPADGSPAQAVDLDKQKRMTRAALAYMKRHHLLQSAARFDVVAVVLNPITADAKRSTPSIQHFVNAFEAVGKFQLYS